MKPSTKPTIGIIGAGKFGTALGQLAVKAGYTVLIASSKPAEHIRLTIELLVPGAQASEVTTLSQKVSLIFLALPLSRYTSLDPQWFKGKVLIDAMNYWWEVDGLDQIYSDAQMSSSERVQNHFSQSRLIKAFNHIGYHQILEDAHPELTYGRKVVLFASDHAELNELISSIIYDFGFDAKALGPLKYGRILETGWPLFGASLTREDLQPILESSLQDL